jgi:hypothetical protein
MKTPETLLIIGVAAIGVYALSKQEGNGLGGITNILESPAGGGLLPAFDFPAINFPAWPDFNLPSADALAVVSDIALPGLNDSGKGLVENWTDKAASYVAKGATNVPVGIGRGLVSGITSGIYEAAEPEIKGWQAFGEGVAKPTWMPFGRIIEGFRSMANQMAGGGLLGGVSPGTGMTEQNPLDPYERGDLTTIQAGIASGELNPAGMPWESAAKKPGATAPAPQGEASAKEPEGFFSDQEKLRIWFRVWTEPCTSGLSRGSCF